MNVAHKIETCTHRKDKSTWGITDFGNTPSGILTLLETQEDDLPLKDAYHRLANSRDREHNQLSETCRLINETKKVKTN
jgi:hypothetical protein